jgi:hypothetical protein
MRQWVVYTKDDELMAVEDQWTDVQYKAIYADGGTIVGYPAAKSRDDALNYIDKIVDWRN